MRMIALLYQGKELKSEENTEEIIVEAVVIVVEASSSLGRRPSAVLEIGREYEVEITEISRQGD
jgi:hypothetical protein